MTKNKSSRILIVDDSSATRSLIRKELSSEDHQLLEATNGQEAIQIINNVPIDLMTLDIEMPIMTGYEVYRILNSEEFQNNLTVKGNNQIPVVFLTSVDIMEEKKKGFETGAGFYIQKPFLPGELHSAVKRILRPPQIF